MDAIKMQKIVGLILLILPVSITSWLLWICRHELGIGSVLIIGLFGAFGCAGPVALILLRPVYGPDRPVFGPFELPPPVVRAGPWYDWSTGPMIWLPLRILCIPFYIAIPVLAIYCIVSLLAGNPFLLAGLLLGWAF